MKVKAKELQSKLEQLNTITEKSFILDKNVSGYKIMLKSEKGGVFDCVVSCQRLTKSETWNAINTFLKGFTFDGRLYQ